jgi:hypothetical protein
MALIRPARPVTAFLLLIVFGGNFFFPLIYKHWYAFLPQHDHIILGPVYPGWELHSHGELIDPATYRHSRRDTFHPLEPKQTVSAEIDIGPRGKVISLYHLPLENGTILAFGVQLLWLDESIVLPEPSSLIWPADLTTLVPISIFLPPPEKPPTQFL